MISDFLRSVLDWVQTIVGNYGWAVILFSVLIKCVLLPLDVKSRRSMRAMTALNPKVEELKKRYKDDQEKLNQKMSELYKKNKVNPLSGCLPMLLQLPILFIMFSVMRHAAAEQQLAHMLTWIQTNLLDAAGNLIAGDSEVFLSMLDNIRAGAANFGDTQSFLWIKSVFQPDSFMKTVIPTMGELNTMISQYKDALDVDSMQLLTTYASNANGIAQAVDDAIRANCGFTTFNLFLNFLPISIPSNWGTYVNGWFVLPILAGVTQFVSTKLQPTQAETTQKKGGAGAFMKWFFPIFSIWICISSTAAFAIYWVFVNVWSIVTTFGINKYLDEKQKRSQAAKEAIQP